MKRAWWAVLIVLCVVILVAVFVADYQLTSDAIDNQARSVQQHNCLQIVESNRRQNVAILAVVASVPVGQYPTIDQLRSDLSKTVTCDDDGRLVGTGP